MRWPSSNLLLSLLLSVLTITGCNQTAATSRGTEVATGSNLQRAASNAGRLESGNPTSNTNIISTFKDKFNPDRSIRQIVHRGSDIIVKLNSNIYCPITSKVQSTYVDDRYGPSVFLDVLRGPRGIIALTHLTSYKVKAGDICKPGQVIGKSGKWKEWGLLHVGWLYKGEWHNFLKYFTNKDGNPSCVEPGKTYDQNRGYLAKERDEAVALWPVDCQENSRVYIHGIPFSDPDFEIRNQVLAAE